MRMGVHMARKRKKYTPELKAAAVKLVKESAGSKLVSSIARDVDVPESCLHLWVKQHDVDAGKGSADALTTTEKQELAQLRRENRELRMERDFLKKAAAFFAKEST
jgi:transposase